MNSMIEGVSSMCSVNLNGCTVGEAVAMLQQMPQEEVLQQCNSKLSKSQFISGVAEILMNALRGDCSGDDLADQLGSFYGKLTN